MSEAVRCTHLWRPVSGTSGVERCTACFSKPVSQQLQMTPSDPSHRARALGEHAPVRLRRELLHGEGPLHPLLFGWRQLSALRLGGLCQAALWVTAVCQGKQSPESDGELSQHVTTEVPPIGPGEGLGVQALITAATFRWFPSLFPFSSSSSFPFLNWGRGEGKEAVFDLGGGKKSVLFRLLANTTNSV